MLHGGLRYSLSQWVQVTLVKDSLFRSASSLAPRPVLSTPDREPIVLRTFLIWGLATTRFVI